MSSFAPRTYLGFLRSWVKSYFTPTPLVYIWEATYRCNMRCWFCKKQQLNSEYHANELKTKDALSLLGQGFNLGARLFYVTGGEPLLRQDVGEVLGYAKELGMVTMMGTNGYFIEDAIDRIKGKVDYLRVSIDSLKYHDEIRGVPLALSKALAGIKMAQAAGMKVVINSVISFQNIEEMGELVGLAEEHSCEITFAPIMHSVVEKRKEELLSLYKRYAASVRFLKKSHPCIVNADSYLDLVQQGGIGSAPFFCRAAEITLSISPQGEVCLPCNYLPVEKIAFVKNTRLERIWFSDTARKIRKEMQGHASCIFCTNRCYLLPSLLFSMGGIINIISNPLERKKIL